MGIVNSFIELSPILLSAVSITSYSLEHGNLRPSIVFTSLTLFSDLHSSLRTLPQMVADIYESWISYKRVERYLEEPEMQQFVAPSDKIVFKEATFDWPTTYVSQQRLSGLHNITLTFLISKLNVVIGETGSGKSLLLATMLSETNLKSGEVGMPRQKPGEKQRDEKRDWIIPGSTAMVSQPPWIDDATIQENILFGLPFQSSRYHDVMEACALEQDIKRMKKGDATKVGAKGAMLSDGQRWRIALARAIYSRVSILLLDDILSAVDGTVAAWILEHALTGASAQGRTIIMVTHNVDLCIKHANYMVELGGNTVKRATMVEMARIEAVGADKSIEQSKKMLGEISQDEHLHEGQSSVSGRTQPSRDSARSSLSTAIVYIEAAGDGRRVSWLCQ